MRVPERLVRYAIIAAHGAMASLRAYEPNVDAKLQAAADRAAHMLPVLINNLHDYEEAYIDKASEEESRAYSKGQA